jgi:protocatechuate 3,4-dioxygenase beta subunit
VARNVRVSAQRRASRQRHAAVPEAVEPADRVTGRELLAVLDEELGRLPARYREPLVLCYLEGLTRDEAAARLDVPVATLKSQLERGRKKLGDALTRRGCAPAAGLVALGACSLAGAATPAALLPTIVQAALHEAKPSVAALARDALPAMLCRRTMAALVLLVGLIGAGIGVRSLAAGAQDKPSTKEPTTRSATTAASAQRPAETLAGRVLDPAGKPVPDAIVQRFQGGGRRSRPAAERLGTTDADGRFRCKFAGRGSNRGGALVATAAGFAPGWVHLTETGAEKTIRLARDLPIRGRLVDLEGKAVAGALVRLRAVGTTSDGDLQSVFNAMRLNPEWLSLENRVAALAPVFNPETRTGADGRFELKGVGQDRLALLRFEARGLEASEVYVVIQSSFDPKVVLRKPSDRASGFAPDLRLAVYGATFTHAARPSHDITGRVTDAATGQPVANVTLLGTAAPVSAFGEPHWRNAVEVKTGKDGRFLLSGLPKAARRFLHVQPGDNPYLDRLIEVQDVAALKTVRVDIKLDRCVVVQGRLTDKATGKPVLGEARYLPLADNPLLKGLGTADYKLYRGRFFSLNPTGVWESTDEHGRFKLRVPPGPGVLLARADTDRDPEARYTAIRVEEKDRKYLRKRDPVARSSRASRMAKTRDRSLDDEAFYTGTMTWPLRWENGYAIINPAAKDEVVKVRIPFDSGRSVRGKVIGPDGKPVAGAEVIGVQATNEFRPTTLPGDTFTAYAVSPDRPREMYFLHEGKKLAGALTVRSTDAEAVVKLKPWATITGRVLTAEGKPAAKAEINFQLIDGVVDGVIRQNLYRDKARSALRTDAQGRFRLEGMFPGLEVRVFARTPGLRVSNASRPVIPEAGQTLDVGDITLPATKR